MKQFPIGGAQVSCGLNERREPTTTLLVSLQVHTVHDIERRAWNLLQHYWPAYKYKNRATAEKGLHRRRRLDGWWEEETTSLRHEQTAYTHDDKVLHPSAGCRFCGCLPHISHRERAREEIYRRSMTGESTAERTCTKHNQKRGTKYG